ncbi:helix-turn-helix transcriptional regulator [Cohnella lubricantis]|uniref:Helix-turn-helix transcriptional regulator n=2 Tax=Cohnella TaxID=329857 RepID=A0A841T3S1_9BACL|nr:MULTISPECIES: helix-turn-helix transcriptional regulator [Paenibacillaceae]MBB6676233.1 helix-turn-helix transcriptional regulator [Cohnella lubricantis]MBB6690742.1 helix-turn-helix transcriptional regulator [Cohnella xylanilytica]MBP2117262.1 transcriptional regulator with XRE-family HTH domain [Cohnella lubricantis]
MSTFAQIVGAKIRLYRMEQNLTQEQLAESIGMAATYLGQIERGEKNVKLQTIEKIALALHMSVYDLFSDEKEANLQQKKWLWASILLLLKHNDAKQRQAYRILRELLEPATEDS